MVRERSRIRAPFRAPMKLVGNKFRLVAVTLFYLLLTCLLWRLIILFERAPSGLAFLVIGLFLRGAMLLFGFVFLYLLSFCLGGRPEISFDKNGIAENARLWGNNLYKWEDIVGIELDKDRMGDPVIILEVRKMKSYWAGSNIILRWLVREYAEEDNGYFELKTFVADSEEVVRFYKAALARLTR